MLLHDLVGDAQLIHQSALLRECSVVPVATLFAEDQCSRDCSNLADDDLHRVVEFLGTLPDPCEHLSEVSTLECSIAKGNPEIDQNLLHLRGRFLDRNDCRTQPGRCLLSIVCHLRDFGECGEELIHRDSRVRCDRSEFADVVREFLDGGLADDLCCEEVLGDLPEAFLAREREGVCDGRQTLDGCGEVGLSGNC